MLKGGSRLSNLLNKECKVVNPRWMNGIRWGIIKQLLIAV